MLLPELIDLIYESFECDKLDQLCLSKRHFYRDEMFRRDVTYGIVLNKFTIDGEKNDWRINTHFSNYNNGSEGSLTEYDGKKITSELWYEEDGRIFSNQTSVSDNELWILKLLKFNF
jgi:hypothetical protein